MHADYTLEGHQLLEDTVAVVTGAGRGIGRAVAALFAAHGSTVFAVARTASDLESLALNVAEPGRIVCAPGYLTDRAFVHHLFHTVDEAYGRIDILVNNAGCAPFGSILEMDPEDFRSCLEINVWSAFLCTQQALRIMRRSGRGKVITSGRSAAIGPRPEMPAPTMPASTASVVSLNRLRASSTARE